MMIGYVDMDVPVGEPRSLQNARRIVSNRRAAFQATAQIAAANRRTPAGFQRPETRRHERRPGRSSKHHATVMLADRSARRWPDCAPALTGENSGKNRRRDIPAPFAPFEYLVGRWNGQGVPKDNPAKQFRGWAESTHGPGCSPGKTGGMTVAIEGGKDPGDRHADHTSRRAKQSIDSQGIEPGPGEADRFRGDARQVGQAPGARSMRRRGKQGKPGA